MLRTQPKQDPKDAIQDTAVVHPWDTARLVRQHRPDGRPLIMRDFVAHDSRLVWELESCAGRHHRSAQELKAVVAEQALELRLLKKSMIADGGDEE
jgi:hypothetical protein